MSFFANVKVDFKALPQRLTSAVMPLFIIILNLSAVAATLIAVNNIGGVSTYYTNSYGWYDGWDRVPIFVFMVAVIPFYFVSAHFLIAGRLKNPIRVLTVLLVLASVVCFFNSRFTGPEEVSQAKAKWEQAKESDDKYQEAKKDAYDKFHNETGYTPSEMLRKMDPLRDESLTPEHPLQPRAYRWMRDAYIQAWNATIRKIKSNSGGENVSDLKRDYYQRINYHANTVEAFWIVSFIGCVFVLNLMFQFFWVPNYEIRRWSKTPSKDQTNVLYERVWGELNGGNLEAGLWARLLAESNGNEEKTKAAYLKERVKQLQEEPSPTEVTPPVSVQGGHEMSNKENTGPTASAPSVSQPPPVPASDTPSAQPPKSGILPTGREWFAAFVALIVFLVISVVVIVVGVKLDVPLFVRVLILLIGGVWIAKLIYGQLRNKR